MSKKVALPLMLWSLGIFAVTQTTGCSSSGGGGGTGGAKADAGTGGKVDSGAGTGGVTGTGGKVDAGGDVTGTGGVGTGGRVDAGGDVTGTGGMGTGGADAAVDRPADLATGDAPADMSMPTDAPSDASFVATTCGMARFMGNGDGTALSAADFCTIYLALCANGARDAASPTRTACETAYSATSGNAIATYGTNGACKSVHVCNAFNTGNTTVHCPHAEGMAPCAP